MTGAKGIIAIGIGHRCEFRCKLGTSLFFSLFESEILQQEHATVRQGCRFRHGILTDNIGRHRDALPQQLSESSCSRGETVFFFVTFSSWTPQMAHQDHTPTAFQNRFYRGQRHHDPAIIGNGLLIIEGHIEIHSH